MNKVKTLDCSKFGFLFGFWFFFFPPKKACDFNTEASHPKDGNLIHFASFP